MLVPTWKEHDKILHLLTVNAASDLVQLIDANPRLSAESVAELMVLLSNRYGERAAASAFQALRSSRETYKLWDTLPEPVLADPAAEAMVRGATAWALQTKRIEGGRSPLEARRPLIGVLERMVRRPAHDTVWESTRIAGTRFARVPTAKACAFCLMLASRGAVYTSRESASRSSGVRGANPEDLAFHEYCRCLVIESYTDADLPQIVLDLQTEWQQAVGADHITWEDPEDQRRAWDVHVKETRPLGSAIREIRSDGTAVIYPPATDIAVDAGRLRDHAGFNPKKPTSGAHTGPAARQLVERLKDGSAELTGVKTFYGGDDPWFTDPVVVAQVLGGPAKVTRVGFSYEYEAVVDGPDGPTAVRVVTGPTKRPRGRPRKDVRTEPLQVTSVYPFAGPKIYKAYQDADDGSVAVTPVELDEGGI